MCLNCSVVMLFKFIFVTQLNVTIQSLCDWYQRICDSTWFVKQNGWIDTQKKINVWDVQFNLRVVHAQHTRIFFHRKKTSSGGYMQCCVFKNFLDIFFFFFFLNWQVTRSKPLCCQPYVISFKVVKM